MPESIPHPNNFCGGNFQDWLEVMLTPSCNGKCSWCVEKDGFKPQTEVDWLTLAKTIISTDKKNIILLGGEPTLYNHLRKLIRELHFANLNVYITTNGSKLTLNYVHEFLEYITGINISIHHYDLIKNKEITGIDLNEDNLISVITRLKNMDKKVRLNCNCIKNYIDSKIEMLYYIEWAKNIGVEYIRFAELKIDENNFVDLAKVFNYEYGLNDDPFKLGCNFNCVINNVNVNFRQMCGFQTNKRCKHENPKQYEKQVLYYDGIIYNGWQKEINTKEIDNMAKETNKTNVKRILNLFKDRHINEDEASTLIEKDIWKTNEALLKAYQKLLRENDKLASVSSGVGCVY